MFNLIGLLLSFFTPKTLKLPTKSRYTDEVILHTSATRPDWYSDKTLQEKIKEIRRWHTSPPNNWSDIGYHFLIDRDGTIGFGRDINKTGAHTKGHNTNTIGICLIGGHGGTKTDKFEDHYTPEQEEALLLLLNSMKQAGWYTKLTGHNQYAAKGCPCFYVPHFKKLRNL